MEKKLLALALLLDRCGFDQSIDDISKRKSIQKTVYLSQAFGLDLGYSYGWYLMGPYSPRLTQDYYNLAVELSEDGSWRTINFSESVNAKIEKIKSILSPPRTVHLEQPEWLELLASYHFLKVKSGKTEEELLETLKVEKSTLYPYAKQAKITLQSQQLIN